MRLPWQGTPHEGAQRTAGAVAQCGEVRGQKTGGGSRKGIPNKVTKTVKEMVVGALDAVGGQAYLERQAEENPKAFLTLVGKVMPIQVVGGGEDDAPITFKVEYVRPPTA